MTPAELQAWQDRCFGTGFGAQARAAAALATKLPTYRSWLKGRRTMPATAVRLAEIAERSGPVDIVDPDEGKVEWRGQLYTKTELARIAGISRQTLWGRLARWKDVEKAMTTPVSDKPRPRRGNAP